MPATAAQVFGPTTVNPGFNSTGEKTLLTMNTTLLAGGKNVIVAVVAPNGGSSNNFTGTFRIKKGATILYETQSFIFNIDENKNNPFMVGAVDTSPSGNDTYTFTVNVTTAATASFSVHVQAIVIKADDAVFNGGTSWVGVSSGSTATLISISTNFAANSKVVVIGASIQGASSYGNWSNYIDQGNVRLMMDTTVLASNQFLTRDHSSARPACVSLIALSTPNTSNQTYSVELYNNSGRSYSAFAWVVAFTVSGGAFLDTGSVSLTSGSQVTVGNLSTMLSGDVAVIGLAAVENTGSSAATFAVDAVVLQKDNSTTGQIGNRVQWYINASTYNRSGILPLFMVSVNSLNPSYQVKMTAPASGLNGETKILAFTVSIVVSVSDGGVGVDSVSVSARISVLDVGTSVETTGLTSSIPTSDIGSGVETMDLSVVVPIDDIGVGVEFIVSGVHQPVDDIGSGLDEVVMLLKEVLDTGVGTELVDMARGIFDTGIGTDVVNSPQFNPLVDTGLGVDTPVITVPQFDVGIGIDTIDMVKEVLDVGMGVDVIPFLSREVLDTGGGFEVISLVTSVISHDFAVGTDVVGLVSVVQVVDAGVGVDLGETQLSIYGVVTLDNSVIVGVHSIPYRDLARDGLPIQTQRRFVDDRVYVGGVEVGVVTVEWEDKVADIVPGVRTVRVAGVVRLVE
jgi:hypothetical protein